MNKYKRISFLHSGVAMVEFAIVLPLLIMILFGITELGRALYQQNTLYKALSTGSRYIARVNGILDADCVAQTGWASANITAQNLIIYGTTTVTPPPLIPNLDAVDAVTIAVESRPLAKTNLDGDPVIENICVISITAEADFAGLFSDHVIPFTDIEPFMIRAETEERYIGL
ncbi:MAG: TadE family protein [Pseudomonadota bacterium]